MMLFKLKCYCLISLTVSIFLNRSILFANNSDISLGQFHRNYNIILITVDTLRSDHLSCYGYFRKTSPDIDKLAEDGILFKNAFSTASYTLPSMASIHTSLYPLSHGVFDIGKDRLPLNIKTLAEILNESGYETAHFFYTKDLHMDPSIGFVRGFKYIKDIYSESSRFFIGKERGKLFKWLKAVKEKNFFLCYHNLNIHAPYLPSLKYKKRFTDVKNYNGNIIDSIKKLRNAEIYRLKNDLLNPQSRIYKLLEQEITTYPDIFYNRITQKKIINLFNIVQSSSVEKRIEFWSMYDSEPLFLSSVDSDSPFDVQYLIDIYDACILEFDQKFIRPLIRRLKKLNLYDNTMIIITGDHGEEFNEHGSLSHRNLKLYDELIRIPLIIKLPKGLGYKNSRIENLVQTIDIMPTILNILNISMPLYIQGMRLILPRDSNENNSPIREYIYTQNSNIEAIRSREYKLIHHVDNNLYELYNLIEDPDEKNNIYETNPVMANKMKRDLYRWRKGLIFYHNGEENFSAQISDATKEKIKKTGYW